MKILGITGRSGSGKGYVSALFAEYGIPTIDSDAIVHRLYREHAACIAELTASFGAILTDDGVIDRKKLAQIVFSDDEKLKTLNSIVHRYVAEEIKKACALFEEQGKTAVLIDAPQLYEAHLENICDLVIAVKAPEALRIERICRRDEISEEGAESRLAHQLNDSFFDERADVIIVNDGESDIRSQIETVLNRMTADV